MFRQVSGHFTIQSSWHMKLTITHVCKFFDSPPTEVYSLCLLLVNWGGLLIDVINSMRRKGCCMFVKPGQKRWCSFYLVPWDTNLKALTHHEKDLTYPKATSLCSSPGHMEKTQGRVLSTSPAEVPANSQHQSVQFSCSVISDSLWPHVSQDARPPCPSPTPRVYSNSCPLSWWCHPAISFSVIPFSSCLQSLSASGSLPMSQLFAWGGQSTGVSDSASVLPMNTQDWSPLGWTGWISLQSNGLSR